MNGRVAGRVAVLGNGPVGQSAALLLARWGVGVLLLDARPERELTGSRSICQQRDVLDIWESAGAGARIAAEGMTWTSARTFYRDRELFSYVLYDAGQSMFPPFVNLSQARTEQLLDERIATQPLIETRWSHQVTGIAQDGTGVTITAQTPDGPAELTAGYAIACTGAHSAELRRTLGISFDGRSFDDRFLICDIKAELPGRANERRFYFDPDANPGRQVLIHPCPDSTFRIDWQVPPDYDLDAERADGRLDARIRAIAGNRPYEIVWMSVYSFQSRLADRMRAGRVLLAGDCAHLMAPFGARGLNSGVADAENAAWKLAYVLNGWAGERLLETYHDERHAAAVENLDVTTATMDFLVPQTERQRAHRHAVLSRAATDPAARAQVDSGRLAEPFWYVASPLTTPCAGREFGGRPPRGAVPPAGPGILVPDVPVELAGRRTRLRALARDGMLLLVTQDAAAVAARACVPGPVRVLWLAAIDATGALAMALAPRPREVWVIRPDAYVAAVLDQPGPAELTAAVRRALGYPPSGRWSR